MIDEAISLVGPSIPTPHRKRIGDLEICDIADRVYWRGQMVRLTRGEFKIVRLVATAGRDVAHEDVYAAIRGPGFYAGDGQAGIRANVRTFIKRIRRKFEEVDVRFDRIETYPKFGYRWRDGTAA